MDRVFCSILPFWARLFRMITWDCLISASFLRRSSLSTVSMLRLGHFEIFLFLGYTTKDIYEAIKSMSHKAGRDRFRHDCSWGPCNWRDRRIWHGSRHLGEERDSENEVCWSRMISYCSREDMTRLLQGTKKYLDSSRPTAVNLMWATARILTTLENDSTVPETDIEGYYQLLLLEAKKMTEEVFFVVFLNWSFRTWQSTLRCLRMDTVCSRTLITPFLSSTTATREP